MGGTGAGIQQPTSKSQQPTSNIEHPTSNIQHRTSNSQRPTANSQCNCRQDAGATGGRLEVGGRRAEAKRRFDCRIRIAEWERRMSRCTNRGTRHASRFFRHHFTATPYVNGGPVEAGGLARHQSGSPQCAPGTGQRVFVFTVSRFHLWAVTTVDYHRNYHTLSTRPPVVCRGPGNFSNCGQSAAAPRREGHRVRPV